LSVILNRLFHHRNQLVRLLLGGSDRTWAHRLRFVTQFTAMAIPAGLALAAAAGYSYSAQQLADRFLLTVWYLVAVLVTRGLVARWLFIRQWRLARHRAEQRANAEAEAAAGAGETSAAQRAAAASQVSQQAREAIRQQDVEALMTIDLQLQQLLRIVVTFALLVGGWVIWDDMFPALRALGRVELWSNGEMAATPAVTPPASEAGAAKPATATPPTRTPGPKGTTLGDLLLTLLIAVVTVLAGKNLPGLLEVLLLERLPLDKGARNALTTICGYGIMFTGLIVGCNAIGLSWQNIQWFAAAMTVGLGFGLQEIFANLVSGLILLFERPIRVGDVVTLGDVTGTVTQIRIRATTITDSDRKELIVPNKDLITGRLLNWTLSDHINRLKINIGVAYGSDTAQVRQLMLATARAHPDVLADPPPTVTFDTFGDNTLNFVLRCYLGTLDKRSETQHELNTQIYDRFMKAGIEIAFPQRDIHIRSMSIPEITVRTPHDAGPVRRSA
jgi:potassium efflux system protein